MSPGEPGCQSLVRDSQKQYHHRTADIHMPVWHGPNYLRAILANLVRLAVAAMVRLLAGAGNDEHRGLRDERKVSARNVIFLTTKAGDFLLQFRLGHHYERLPLREARAWSVPRQV